MKAVADTNVIAYYLLRTEPFFDRIREFWRAARKVLAPDSWRVELLNVLWLAVRAGVIRPAEAEMRLRWAERLVTRTCPLNHLRSAALRLSLEYDHPACDTVFVALAVGEGCALVTFDERLLSRFPDHACRPEDLL
ncbi:MAG: type II toxin-antitoxin system VapC family toxin [Deltaproteobacteria bacterium]|nr:type II toxin-antitoxin system VapC family toxin [Deltaproteobacteria bacterium]